MPCFDMLRFDMLRPALALSALTCLAIGGCASNVAQPGKSTPDSPLTADTAGGPVDPAIAAAQSAQQLFDKLRQRQANPAAQPIAAAPPAGGPAVAVPIASATAPANTPLRLTEQAPSAVPAVSPPAQPARTTTPAFTTGESPTSNRLTADYARELAVQLDADAQRGTNPALATAITLAALSPLDASIADRLTTTMTKLDGENRHLVDLVRGLALAASSGGKTSTLATPSTIAPASTVQIVLAAAAKLGESRGLRMATLAACSQVESFGRYIPMPTDRFIAGQRRGVILYAELANFVNADSPTGDSASEGSADGPFAVTLRQSVQLLKESDGTVAVDFGTTEFASRSRSPRRDLFLAQRIDLPANLTIGTYVLNVRITDVASSSETEQKLPLMVIAR